MPIYSYVCSDPSCRGPSRRKTGLCQKCSPECERGWNLKRDQGELRVGRVAETCDKAPRKRRKLSQWYDEVPTISEENYDKLCKEAMAASTQPESALGIWLPHQAEGLPCTTYFGGMLGPALEKFFAFACERAAHKRERREALAVEDAN